MYKEMYYDLFNAITDALEAMRELNFGQAEALLRSAQQRTEERYMETGEPAMPENAENRILPQESET